MSQYLYDPNDREHDWGGVHVNSTIISHAFYLMAEGLPEAIGLRAAEAIVYRCLTHHLFALSQFVDFRLGCVLSAEELFGKGSTEARVTAQAFDAVEIFASPPTPEPAPLPVVTGPDSTLLVYFDNASNQFNLVRRETAQGDKAEGSILAYAVSLVRPAVTGDGSSALFVSTDFDLCAVETSDLDSRLCLNMPGIVHSVAFSPNGRYAAFVLRDIKTGLPEGKITVLDVVEGEHHLYDLVAPVADGVEVDSVLFADAMTFSTDSTTLIYDALSELRFGNGPTMQAWSIYSLRMESGQTTILVAPKDGIDSGNPAVGRAGNRYIAYDALDLASNVSAVMVLDLFTGESHQVGSATGGFSLPSFLGDETGVIYSAADTAAVSTGRSIYKQNISTDRKQGVGEPALWYRDANLGVVYRRGDFHSTNALPEIILSLSADQIPANGSVTFTATASDKDGTISRVEYYEGSRKLGDATAAPYSFTWQNVPAGNHLVIGRAIDNVGATRDSSPRFLTVTGGAPGNKPPTVSMNVTPDTITLPGSVTLTATATDADGTITRVVFYDGHHKIAELTTPPYTYIWQDPAPGNHLLSAHAIDNDGAEVTSSARFLTVAGRPPQNDRPELAIIPIAPGKVRLKVKGKAGYYIISMSEDFDTWVDIYPVTVDESGAGSVDDATLSSNTRLFFRVRREP
jgi:hypothetical protein